MDNGNALIKKANPISVPACTARPVHGWGEEGRWQELMGKPSLRYGTQIWKLALASCTSFFLRSSLSMALPSTPRRPAWSLPALSQGHLKDLCPPPFLTSHTQGSFDKVRLGGCKDFISGASKCMLCYLLEFIHSFGLLLSLLFSPSSSYKPGV